MTNNKYHEMPDNEPELAHTKQYIAEMDRWIGLGEERGIDMTDGKIFRAYVLDMIISCQLASTLYGAARKAGKE